MVYDGLRQRLVARAHIVDSCRLEKLLQALGAEDYGMFRKLSE